MGVRRERASKKASVSIGDFKLEDIKRPPLIADGDLKDSGWDGIKHPQLPIRMDGWMDGQPSRMPYPHPRSWIRIR